MATLCIYCGVEPGTTNDHVPAKNLFPKPLPKLITVPSCGTCNQRYKKDEELFRAWILFGSAGVTKHGKLLWDQKLHRGYKKNLGLKKVIARSLRQVDLVTQGGIYIGRRWEISPDAKRIENVLRKIVRGLFWVEYKERLPEDISTEIIPIHSKRDPRISEVIPRTRQSAAFWEGIFECRYIRSHMNTYESFWLMAFYRQNYFAVKVDFQEHDAEL